VKSFGVPHLHLITREGYEVWTYADNERGALRRRASALYEEGIKPVILTCHTDAVCVIYRPDRLGQLKESKIHARIDRVRNGNKHTADQQRTVRTG
jgi:hypothetical protein